MVPVLCLVTFLFLMTRRPPSTTRTYTLVPYTTRFRSPATRRTAAPSAPRRWTPRRHPGRRQGLAQRSFEEGLDPAGVVRAAGHLPHQRLRRDRKSTRLNSSH